MEGNGRKPSLKTTHGPVKTHVPIHPAPRVPATAEKSPPSAATSNGQSRFLPSAAAPHHANHSPQSKPPFSDFWDGLDNGIWPSWMGSDSKKNRPLVSQKIRSGDPKRSFEKKGSRVYLWIKDDICITMYMVYAHIFICSPPPKIYLFDVWHELIHEIYPLLSCLKWILTWTPIQISHTNNTHEPHTFSYPKWTYCPSASHSHWQDIWKKWIWYINQ